MIKELLLAFFYSFSNFFFSLGDYLNMVFEVFFFSIRKPPSWALLREQAYNVGVLSLTVVAITGMSTGIVLAAQSFYQLNEKGLAGVTGIMVAKAMITELGPVLTALMVTGRVGSAMTAELGTMRVTEQIDALKSMAVNPLQYLIVPRFLSGFFMIPLLTTFSILLGIFGGYFISLHLFGMSYATFFEPIPDHVSVFDMTMGIVKSFFFGFLFITVCCYKGIKTKGGAAGVGKSTTQSVVISCVLILVSDFLLTIGLNTIHQELLTHLYG